MDGDFTLISTSIAPAGKTQSEPPPTRKKPRHNRGRFSKSHAGDRPPNPNKVVTNETPGDYIQIIRCTNLKEEEKLPSYMVSEWKRTNDRETFTRRINQDTAEHALNPTLQFMRENYRKVNDECKKSGAPGSSRIPSGSMEVIPPTQWEDINVDDEVTRPLSNLRIRAFPHRCQRTNGFTDVGDNITKLIHLTNHPECFPLSHIIPSFRKNNTKLRLPGVK